MAFFAFRLLRRAQAFRRWGMQLGLFLVMAVYLSGMARAADGMAAEPTALHLADSQPTVQAWPAVRIWEDPAGTLGLADVMAAPNQFATPTTATNTLGLRKEAV